MEQACKVAQTQLDSCRANLQNHQRQKKILHVSFQKAQDKVDQLEGELSEATPDAAAIEVLEDALANAQNELEHAEGVFEDMVIQRDRLNKEARTNKDKMDATHRAVEDLEFKLNKAHTTVRKLQGQREDELKEKNQTIVLVETARKHRETWVEEMTRAQTEVDNATELARRISPQRVDVPPRKTSADLMDMLERLTATRRETEKELGGSQDELLRLANEAKKTHKNAMQDFQDIKNLRDVSLLV